MNLHARIHIITEATITAGCGGGGGVGRAATADILVGALFFQDRLEGSISKNDASREEAVDDGDRNLY